MVSPARTPADVCGVHSDPALASVLNNLPTAHPALAIGHRVIGHDCHGVSRLPVVDGKPTDTRRKARIRFIYFPMKASHDPHAAYHAHLVCAEVLLGRVMAARAVGLRALAPALDVSAEARATVPPPRRLFATTTLEYRRWYEDDGTERAQPLSQEDLAERLVSGGLPWRQALDRAMRRSHALPAADQEWLIRRRSLPPHQRPLDQRDFRALIDAIDGIWRTPVGAGDVARANRQIAVRVATFLAAMLDEYVAPPFATAALNEAFHQGLLAHLRESIECCREVGMTSGVLLQGSRAWFAAKAARMRVEHQIGLALSPDRSFRGAKGTARGTFPMAAAG
jgi:hypothetical protein